jgi:tRNA nucleotidyltransferase (CCA-adding enzyme)
LLVDVARFIDENPTKSTVGGDNDKVKPEPVVLRWAGGWVRDKLLGIESNDIDTAINCMTGEAFALRLKEFCGTPANCERHAVGKDDVGSLHKIARNPDKSKHLETTTTRLFGLDVDFVNLRRETYTEDSRNPQMEFGTAEEDALRRDATVNALFYNLNTGEVEDFTGGLRDMQAKLIRTPLEPLQTFTDDPLRVLRLVRFASRLGFTIDESAEAVMAAPRVLDALKLKISRERVGVELEKMLKGLLTHHSGLPMKLLTLSTGKNACVSLRLIDKLGLYHTIFTDPARQNMPNPDTSNWATAYECLLTLEKNKTPGSIYELLVTSEEARHYAWNLVTLTPWAQLPDDPPLKGGKPAFPLATQAAREGFKAPNKLSDIVTAAHRHRPKILELKKIVCTQQPAMKERDRFGMAIRDWDSKGGNWRLQVLYAVLVDVEARSGTKGVETETVLAEWQRFLDHLVELDVVDAPSIKRLVDGRILAKELGMKPGKWTGPALEVAMAWQLRNPDATDYSGAVEEVRERKDELGIK